MSRRYEWLEPGCELVTDPDEMMDIWDEDGEPEPGQAYLVLGNPYATAALIPGTPDEIIATLQEYIDIVRANTPPTVVDAVTNEITSTKEQ
jgi:alkanesulfonate monooxygenase SsuD/methylene tetrahydromethanopterin reductase-like flavin-dependent oxidoreductase (luciferase family)